MEKDLENQKNTIPELETELRNCSKITLHFACLFSPIAPFKNYARSPLRTEFLNGTLEEKFGAKMKSYL